MTAPEVIRIEGVARHYAWGSPTAIPQLLGLEADGTPVAELWFGAHPGDPSPVPDLGTTLDDVIASDPVQLLGSDVARRFGNRMPFLVKVLAADVALSIQVHPTIEQAREGFSSEEARGIPRDAPERNYRDDNHKPELLCALTPFEALCGFRPVAQTLEVLDALDIAELRPLRDLLAGPDGLRAAFTALLQHPDPTALVAAVSERALAADDDGLRAQRLLTHDFPGDIGIVLSLLLNHVRLEPGDAIFLRAGNVHSYLRGTGIEIMANSDNVLRCALTPKHVAVDQVLAVADFTPMPDPRCPVDTDGFGATYLTPVDDFHLQAIDLDAYGGSCAAGLPGPHVVLCVDGHVTVSRSADRIVLRPGQAAFVVAGDGSAFTLDGAGRVYVASVGSLAS